MKRPGDQRQDAIVVLGCRVEPSGALSTTLRRRADWAKVSYFANLGAFVVASGGRRWGEHVEAERLRIYLEGQGVPGAAIHTELLSLTTTENALFTRDVLRRLGARRALIVTCSWHMRRALACFRHVGVDALPLSVPPAPTDLRAKVYRAAHEAISGRIDAWKLARVDRVRARFGGHPFEEPAT